MENLKPCPFCGEEGRQTMRWQEYEVAKRQYDVILEWYQAICDERNELLQRTQPKAVNFEAEKVQSGYRADLSLEEYADEVERRKLNERQRTAEGALDSARSRVEHLRHALYASDNLDDVVYVLRKLEHRRLSEIEKRTHYSRGSLKRILKKLSQNDPF